jgi:hypothetical protein
MSAETPGPVNWFQRSCKKTRRQPGTRKNVLFSHAETNILLRAWNTVMG